MTPYFGIHFEWRETKNAANSYLSDVVSLNLTKTYDLNIVELFLYISLLTKLTN